MLGGRQRLRTRAEGFSRLCGPPRPVRDQFSPPTSASRAASGSTRATSDRRSLDLTLLLAGLDDAGPPRAAAPPSAAPAPWHTSGPATADARTPSRIGPPPVSACRGPSVTLDNLPGAVRRGSATLHGSAASPHQPTAAGSAPRPPTTRLPARGGRSSTWRAASPDHDRPVTGLSVPHRHASQPGRDPPAIHRRRDRPPHSPKGGTPHRMRHRHGARHVLRSPHTVGGQSHPRALPSNTPRRAVIPGAPGSGPERPGRSEPGADTGVRCCEACPPCSERSEQDAPVTLPGSGNVAARKAADPLTGPARGNCLWSRLCAGNSG